MTLAIVQFILLAVGMAAAMGLFFSLKREIQIEVRRNRRRLDEILQQIGPPKPDEPESNEPFQAVLQMICQRPRAGFNLSKRVEALRLLRRGESIAHVSAALGVTQREVELLIRVQQISTERARISLTPEAGASGAESRG